MGLGLSDSRRGEFADAVERERERGDLRAAWGEARYAEAEAAARATLEAS